MPVEATDCLWPRTCLDKSVSDHQHRHMLTMRFWYTPMTPLAAIKINSTATPHIVASTREVRISDWVTTYAVAMWYSDDMLAPAGAGWLLVLLPCPTVCLVNYMEALRSCMLQSAIMCMAAWKSSVTREAVLCPQQQWHERLTNTRARLCLFNRLGTGRPPAALILLLLLAAVVVPAKESAWPILPHIAPWDPAAPS